MSSQSINFKVESGLQLLERLKKNNYVSFYPIMFNTDLCPSDLIEISGSAGTGKSLLLINMIVDGIIPVYLGGVETGAIVFNIDGNFDSSLLLDTLEKRIVKKIEDLSYGDTQIETIVADCLKRLYLLEIHDPSQIYVSIVNLENILLEHSSITIIAFDTITAFYWTEQNNRLVKMEHYTQNILKLILKVIKAHNTIVVYTIPKYFTDKNTSTTKEINKFQSESSIYKLMLNGVNDQGLFTACLYLNDTILKTKHFKVVNHVMEWLS